MESISNLIKMGRIDPQLEELIDIQEVGYGEHSFSELYEHISLIWIGYTKMANEVKVHRYDSLQQRNIEEFPYRSSIYKYRAKNGKTFLGMMVNGHVVEYEIPEKMWNKVNWATEYKPDKASTFADNLNTLEELRQ